MLLLGSIMPELKRIDLLEDQITWLTRMKGLLLLDMYCLELTFERGSDSEQSSGQVRHSITVNPGHYISSAN